MVKVSSAAHDQVVTVGINPELQLIRKLRCILARLRVWSPAAAKESHMNLTRTKPADFNSY